MPHRDRVLLALAIWSLPALASTQEPDPLPPLTREVYATGLAEATVGDPNAQNALGMAYFIGWGVVPQDYPTSVEWYRLAADQGRAEAQFHLGGTYDLAACGESRSSSPLLLARGSTGSIPLLTLCRMAMGTRDPEQPPLWIAASDLPVSPEASVLHALECVAGCRRLRHLRGRRLSILLRAGVGPPESGARSLLLLVAGWVLRRHRFGARHRVACGGLAGGAELPATRAGGGGPGSLDDFAHPPRDRCGDAPGGVHVGPAAPGGRRPVEGPTIAIDATTLEANAAMRSIVRRDTGEAYQAYLTRLAAASGIKTPTREVLARVDRKRKKNTSNSEWTSPSDPDAKVAKMNDGQTHLAHKAEHAVDLESGALVAVTVQGADQGDTRTLVPPAITAAEQVEAAHATTDAHGRLEEIVADKGYHSNETMVDLAAVGLRSYISEPDRGRRDWSDAPDAYAPVQVGIAAVSRGARGRRLRPRRAGTSGRAIVRPTVYETGGRCDARTCGDTTTS